jgi:hypothetical protein
MAFRENVTGTKVASIAQDSELQIRNDLRTLSTQFTDYVNDTEWTANTPFLFTNRQALSRLLYLNDLYKLIIGKPGVICEFGVQFGATLSLLSNLRGAYEPYNFARKIVGFDTFEGFTSDLTEAERNIGWTEKDYTVPADYQDFLAQVLSLHEKNAPIPQVNKFELVKGDVTKTFEPWLEENPHVVVGMAIFDMDVYAPTKFVLERILKVMPKGAVLVFDELNCHLFPGETQAVDEVLGIANLKLQHNPHNAFQAWCVIE